MVISSNEAIDLDKPPLGSTKEAEDLNMKLGVLIDTIIDKANGLEKALNRYIFEN